MDLVFRYLDSANIIKKRKSETTDTSFFVILPQIKAFMRTNRPLIAHLSMFMACAFWGLMAPVGKDAMTHGIDGIDMVSFRVLGGAVLFWITSLFVPREHVPIKDILLFVGAAFFGLVTNQCCYTIGLSITSPVNASIVTTSMPIFAMLLSFVILKEPITWKKALGVLTGCSGALILILTSMAAVSDKVGDIRGDLLCLGAQFSFALYLSLFNKLIRRYSVFTINKWMFLWATVLILPFTTQHVAAIKWTEVPHSTWWEAAYVVVFGTYISYILTMIGQKTLRPTVVSIYNYVQPLVSVSVSILTGIGVLQWSQALAVVLVFSGVWMVTKSKSKRDIELQAKKKELEDENTCS
jgi:drug/metabolite transporter (DMT)-like permease